MKPSHKNGVVVVGTSEDMVTGYAVENGNDDFLPAYYKEHFRQEVDSVLTVEQAQEMLSPSYDAIQKLGYNVGPIETKTHKEWCVDVLGSDPDQYDANQQEELDAQAEYDEQEDEE